MTQPRKTLPMTMRGLPEIPEATSSHHGLFADTTTEDHRKAEAFRQLNPEDRLLAAVALQASARLDAQPDASDEHIGPRVDNETLARVVAGLRALPSEASLDFGGVLSEEQALAAAASQLAAEPAQVAADQN